MKSRDNYKYLGEHTAPEANRLLAELTRRGIEPQTSINDNIRAAWPWGPHGTFTKVVISVRAEDWEAAKEIQRTLLKIEI